MGRLGDFFKEKKSSRPIPGLFVATVYLARTSVVARNVLHCSWTAWGPEDVRDSEDLPSEPEFATEVVDKHH